MRAPEPRQQSPAPGAFRFRPVLILGTLCAGSFAATFAVVALTGPGSARQPGMVWVPGGEFTMGTDSDHGWPDEKPAHRVKLDGFYMDVTEVTNAHTATRWSRWSTRGG
jgi:hypothetical protein